MDGAILVFCSYSHHDLAFRAELEAQVSTLVRQRLVTFWSDRRIAPGEPWEESISEKLEAADIILFLISAFFIQSDYCYTTELQRALERHRLKEARVVPIFVRPCDWEGLDFAHIQGLPADGTPISASSNRDEAWTAVIKGIRRIAEELRADRRRRTSSNSESRSPSQGKYDPEAYLRSLTAWRRTALTHSGNFSILATLDGNAVLLSEALIQWLGPLGARSIVISGDPGSGKTHALRSLAARLASECLAGSTTALPVFVTAKRLDVGEPLNVLRRAVPEAGSIFESLIRSGSGVILIDGIDEVPPETSDRLLRFVSDLARATPPSVKVGVTCRPPLLSAVFKALMATSSPPSSLEIQGLCAQVASSLDGVPGEWDSLESTLRQPIALRLLELQSGDDPVTGERTPLGLYGRAINSLIDRELRASPDLRALTTAQVHNLLMDAAREMFAVGTVPARRVWKGRIDDPRRAALLNSLTSAGILALDSEDRLTFPHESIFDYFFAGVLERELSLWDATHLARSNLIYSYNVNRFLVPRLRLRPPLGSTPSSQALRRELVASVARTADGLQGLSRPVSNAQFSAFVDDTGWRRATGFGYWRAVEAPDGTRATSGGLRFDGETPARSSAADGEAVTGISWYDAQQFAWWIGAQIPREKECVLAPKMLEWTSDWHDEARALIHLVGPSLDRGAGANPDVRSSDIGFRVLIGLTRR